LWKNTEDNSKLHGTRTAGIPDKTPALSRSRGGKILCASKKEAYICSCEFE